MAQIKLRRDTYTNWFTQNPILANGEPAYDTTNNKIKVGDGTSHWQSLSYLTETDGSLILPTSGRIVNNTSTWTFGSTGTLTLPLEGQVVQPSYSYGPYSIYDGNNFPDYSELYIDVIGALDLSLFGVGDTLADGANTTTNYVTIISPVTSNGTFWTIQFSQAWPSGYPSSVTLISSSRSWTFGGNGSLTLPTHGVIKNSDGNNILGNMRFYGDTIINSANNGIVIAPGGMSTSYLYIPSNSESNTQPVVLGNYSNSSTSGVTIQANTSSWTFGADGTLTFPDGSKPTSVITKTFTGTINGTILTVTGCTTGTLAYGQYVEGPGVADDTFIIEQTLGNGAGANGGDGTYSVSVSQNIGPITMTAASMYLNSSIKLAEGHAIYQQDEHDLSLYNLLIGIKAEEATIHFGDINTNGVSISNNQEYKVDSALNAGTYMAVAKVDSSDNVLLSSGNAASTTINVGGVSGNTFKYGAKFFNGGEAHIPTGLRIGNNTLSGNYGAALEITTNETSGASFASYKDSASNPYGSFVYGTRFGSPLEQSGAPSPVVAEDWLMEFGASGWDGENLNGGGELAWRVDGSVSPGINPSRAELYVTPQESANQTLGLVVHSSLDVELFGNLKFSNSSTQTIAYPGVTTVPSSSKGSVNDKAGMFAINSSSIFYCIADYVSLPYTATIDISGGNGVDSGIAVRLTTVPSIGWTISFNGQSSIINGVTPQGEWYVIFWNDPITIDTGETFSYGPTALADIWVKQNWGTTTSW